MARSGTCLHGKTALCAEEDCSQLAEWRDADNIEYCEEHRHSLVARIMPDDDYRYGMHRHQDNPPTVTSLTRTLS